MELVVKTSTIYENIVSLLASDIVGRATTFVLYTMVARYLGAYEFGQLSLAVSLFYTFQVIALAGMKTLIAREVARDNSTADQFLINGGAVVVVTSTVSTSLLLLFIRLMGYSRETAWVILVVSLGLLPYALSGVTEAIFQARERMAFIAYAQVPVSVGKLGLAILMLKRGYSLLHIGGLLLAGHVAVMLVEWWLMGHFVWKGRARIDAKLSLGIAKGGATFLGIESISALWASLIVVLLSKLLGETEVGLYAATIQLMVPVLLILQNIMIAVFPMMSRNIGKGNHALKEISERLIELLLVIALPAGIGLFFLADQALLVLYGDAGFLRASGALRIMSWTLVLIALSHAFGRILLAGFHEKVSLRIVLLDVVFGLALGLILISKFGLIGAAVSALCTRIIDLIQNYSSVSRRFFRIDLGSLIWRPAGAGIAMAAYLEFARTQGLVQEVISAGVLYAAVYVALAVLSLGGPRQLKSRFLRILSEDRT